MAAKEDSEVRQKQRRKATRTGVTETRKERKYRKNSAKIPKKELQR